MILIAIDWVQDENVILAIAIECRNEDALRLLCTFPLSCWHGLKMHSTWFFCRLLWSHLSTITVRLQCFVWICWWSGFSVCLFCLNLLTVRLQCLFLGELAVCLTSVSSQQNVLVFCEQSIGTCWPNQAMFGSREKCEYLQWWVLLLVWSAGQPGVIGKTSDISVGDHQRLWKGGSLNFAWWYNFGLVLLVLVSFN